jgi:hypothetical protein
MELWRGSSNGGRDPSVRPTPSAEGMVGQLAAEVPLAVLMRWFPVGWKEQRVKFLN